MVRIPNPVQVLEEIDRLFWTALGLERVDGLTDCPTCKGRGFIIDLETDWMCAECHGTGLQQ